MRHATLTVLVLLALAAPAAAQTTRPVCPGADDDVRRDRGRAAAAVLCIVNAERAARLLPQLAYEARLEAAAQGHSADMEERRFFAHDTPEGRTVADRVNATGYPWAALYENIAFGQTTPRAAMLGWMRSVGHCRAVLAPDVVHLGVGLAVARRPYWTQNFGLPQDTPPPSADELPRDGCPYERLSIAPGPAPVAILALGRTGSRVTVFGRIEDEGAGRRIVVEARRGGRRARKAVRTLLEGEFRTTIRAPRGRGRVLVTVTAPAVPDVYKTGRDARRI